MPGGFRGGDHGNEPTLRSADLFSQPGHVRRAFGASGVEGAEYRPRPRIDRDRGLLQIEWEKQLIMRIHA